MRYVYDDNAPKTRTFIVTDEVEYKNVFSKCDIEVDFNKSMVLLFTYLHRRGWGADNLKKINLDNSILQIYYKFKKGTKSAGCGAIGSIQPTQRWLMVKIDKLDVTNVEFIEQT